MRADDASYGVGMNAPETDGAGAAPTPRTAGHPS